VRGVKIDIEGSELFALRGACRLIERHRTIMQIEMQPVLMRSFGIDVADIADFLEELGYVTFVAEGPGGAVWRKDTIRLDWVDLRATGQRKDADLLICYADDVDALLVSWTGQ
jgi:hypothetical protein